VKSRIIKILHNPKILRKVHGILTIIWILLIIPSLLWWSDSILWIILMSTWANIAGHWSAYQAASSEVDND